MGLERNFKPSGFTYKYDGKHTGLDTLIAIDGYYKSVEQQTRIQPNYPLNAPYHIALMFYRDGLVCSIISDNPWKTFRDRLYPIGTWGTYRIFGDTIECQFVSDNGAMRGVVVTSRVYHIISNSEIVEYYSAFVDEENVRIIHPVNLPKDVVVERKQIKIPHSFYPLENRIDSTEWNWLLNKKWFWDKETYQNRRKK